MKGFPHLVMKCTRSSKNIVPACSWYSSCAFSTLSCTSLCLRILKPASCVEQRDTHIPAQP